MSSKRVAKHDRLTNYLHLLAWDKNFTLHHVAVFTSIFIMPNCQLKLNYLGKFIYSKENVIHWWYDVSKIWELTMFANYSKCLIQIFQFEHFLSIFGQLNVTYLVTLFDRKFRLTILLAMLNETFIVIFKHSGVLWLS